MAAVASSNSLIRLERTTSRRVGEHTIAIDLGNSTDVIGVLWRKDNVDPVHIAYQVGEVKEDYEDNTRQKMGCAVDIRGVTSFRIRSTVDLEVYLIRSDMHVYAQIVKHNSGQLGGNIGTEIWGNNLTAQWWNLPERLSYRCIACHTGQEYDVVLSRRVVGRLVPGVTAVLNLPQNELGQDVNKLNTIDLHPTHPAENMQNWESYGVSMIAFSIVAEPTK